MRVCIRKSDNRIIEAQSGGGSDAYDLDELTAQAVTAAENKLAAERTALEAAAAKAGDGETKPATSPVVVEVDKKAIRQQIADEIKRRVAHNLDVLVQNAVAAGYTKDQVSVAEMDDTKYAKAIAAQNEADKPPPLTKPQRIARMLEREGVTVADLKAVLA